MSRREIFPLRTTETMKMIPDDQLQYVYRRNKEIQDLLRDFDRNHMRGTYEPMVLLKNLSEILEEATAVFISNDPDPLDDRHPHRTHPDSALGNLLKTIFKNDDFMTSLVVSYILVRDNVELSIQGCRVLLACVPGLDSKVVFSEPDDFIPRLYHWAGPEGTNDTLQGYAMGLLAAALENTENASKFRNENAELVPFALDRMRELQVRAYEEHNNLGNTDFSELNSQQKLAENGVPSASNGFEIPSIQVTSNGEKENEKLAAVVPPPPKKRRTEPNLPALLRTETTQRVPSFHNLRNLDDSNSKWDILQPFLIGTQKVYPLSLPTYQRFILQYLAACGEYQDLLVQTFEGNALDLLLDYIDLEKTKDVRLTFDALKYLTSLLVHRKFALEFIEKDGIRALLRLPRTSLASVGVVTCFYYIAYNNDVMEMLCQMGDDIVDETVQYILWCLEHSHESGMASACMFFSQSLFFKAILRRFEQYDGPRKLFNYISTLVLMQCTENTVDLTEEQVHTSTQCVRSVCTTFRAYLLASMYTKVEFWKKQYNGAGAILPCGMRIPYVFQSEVPEFRSMKTYEEVSVDCEAIVSEMCRFTGMPFREAENMKRLGCVQMFLAVRVLSRDWLTISSNVRNDMCVYALESLRLMLCQPTIQTELITQHTYSHSTFDGFTILIQTTLARGDEEPPLRMAALECIRRCVLVEPESWKTLVQKMKEIGTTPSKRQTSKYEMVMNHLERMWTEVRKADGIMSLVDLINLKTPLTEADSIRRLATNVLTGLARHPEVRQILSRLPLIAHGGLQILMREPVSSDKRDIHAGFCKEACQLLQVVAGKKIHFDHHAKEIRSSDKSHRQWVVENTPVSFNQVELLQLIHDHLIKNQLDNVASLLKTEAKLPDRPASRSNSTTSFLSKPLPSTGNNFSKIHDVFPTLAPRTLESEIGGISSAKRASTASLQSPIACRSHSTDDDVFATPTLPRRYTTSGAFPRKLLISPARSRQRPVTPADDSQRPYCDLNSIVTNYFRTQHSTCQNPVTACPPFSLYYPHKCPERIQKTPITANFALRMLDQECLRPHQRTLSQWMNEREIFSKFRQIKVMHDNDESYTRAAFSTDDEHVIVGHFTGELHWLNAESGADESHTNCHGSAITNIQPSSDGSLILTSSAYSRPLSALWRLGHAMERIQMFREDSCVLFANTTMARIIGTNKEKAVVYDTETHHILDTYSSGTEGLQYDKNFASFSPDDRLVFNDGLLWDVRNKNAAIHAFDRLAKRTMWGTFHPQGTQIIINSEVYDIRTFRMLHHVPELARCKVKFNSTGNIAFAAEVHDLMRPDYPDLAYSPFRSFDTRDYSALTTVEGRRPIIDICVSHHDQKLCIVEQVKPQVNDYMVQSSTQMRMYETGRTKDIEDEEEEEEETREGHGGEEDGSSSSSDTDEEMGDDDDDAGSTVRDAFERIGRLGDESEDEIEEGEDGFDFENALNRIIRRQALLRRQRVNSSENGDAGVVDMNDEDDGDDEADDVDLDDDDDVDLDDHLEDEEDDVDPDFDVEDAIDELVNAVDAEVDEDEMGEDDDSDGSWRTASRVGSEDINLDELDEDQAREAENEGDAAIPEDVPAPPVNAAAQVEAARRAILGRGLRGFRMGMMGAGRHRHHRNPAMIHVEQLNARAEEQRLQFMEAIAREREPEENGENGEDESDMEQYQSEEEEINSVSTTVLNPALRRQNRRQQSPEGDS
ncbi:hypothetical protein L3Y34_003367 [Caenorhabditis briggsae]|uniref:LisH domain-containing protein n=2 Tax=Caenorhabditis briggsae TaxID=6238 RepID=A0AAE9A971_CAEBR|nr:hypothetical protein L3Y34_003367 [Caenorhabditis briggsae]